MLVSIEARTVLCKQIRFAKLQQRRSHCSSSPCIHELKTEQKSRDRVGFACSRGLEADV